MNLWPDIVTGIWLLYSAWEDWKKRVIDVGVPTAIVLTRVAVEGPWFLFKVVPALIPFLLFLKFLEVVHWFTNKFDEPIWYEGDTLLLMGVSIYLGLSSIQAFSFLLLSLMSTAMFYVLGSVAKGKKVGEALKEPMPLSPGVLIAYSIVLLLRMFQLT